jgi:hypothetical protein
MSDLIDQKVNELKTGMKEQCMGIKSEAVGKYFAYGEKLDELAITIRNKANIFHIFYEHDYDVEKMAKLSNVIKDMATNMAFITEKIAESARVGDK